MTITLFIGRSSGTIPQTQFVSVTSWHCAAAAVKGLAVLGGLKHLGVDFLGCVVVKKVQLQTQSIDC